VAIAKAGGIAPRVALARDGTDGQKREAAGALRSLASNSNNNRVAIATAGGIAPLVALACDGTYWQKEWAAGALRNLSMFGWKIPTEDDKLPSPKAQITVRGVISCWFSKISLSPTDLAPWARFPYFTTSAKLLRRALLCRRCLQRQGRPLAE